MAVATRPKKSDPDHPVGFRDRNAHEIEAPDRGQRAGEAPESRIGRTREAPDAGEGRMEALEREFTHGRSQS